MSFLDGANKKFYSAPKNAKFSIFGPYNMAMAGKKNWYFLARPENNFESNQSKPILVIVLIKAFIHQSFRQNYFSREIEWAVFTETAS